ncbi:uncharacterized protein LOC114528268 [Dendronephthya gigantea]|uniref:uncharacterized protein LOC114528268 n=1 Tax=Dendronephthya gigantea TaxID=151771 RepID=UPI00106CCE0F|nr:uncharacterized protein LOC114528268 [Dendronephthya gigantea]
MSTRVEYNAMAEASKKDFLSYSSSEDSMFQANFGYHRQYRPRYHYQHTPREQSRTRPRMNHYIQPNFPHSQQRVRSDNNMGYYRPPVYHSGPRYPRYHVPWDGCVRNSQSYRYGDAKTTNSAIIQSSSVTLSSMPQTSAAQSRMLQPSVVKPGQSQASMVKSGQSQPPTVEPSVVKPAITQSPVTHSKITQSSFTSFPHPRVEQISGAHLQASAEQQGSQKLSKTQPRQPPCQPPCSIELGQTAALLPNRTQNSTADPSVEQMSTAQPRMIKAKLTQILSPRHGIKQSAMEQTLPRVSTPYSLINQPSVPKITNTTHLSQPQSPLSKPIFHQTSTEYRRSPPEKRNEIRELDIVQTSMAHPNNTRSLPSQVKQETVNVERVSTTRPQVSVSQHGTSMIQPSMVQMKQTSGVSLSCNTQPKITKTVMTQPTRVQNSMFSSSMTKISMTQSSKVQTSIPMVSTSPRKTKTSIEEGKKEKSMTQQNSVKQLRVELTSQGGTVTKAESMGGKLCSGSESFLVQYPAINRSYDHRWKSTMVSNGDNRITNFSQRYQAYSEVKNTVVKRRNDDQRNTNGAEENGRFENPKRNRWDLKEKDVEKPLKYESTKYNNISINDCKVEVNGNKEASQSGYNHAGRSWYLQTGTKIMPKVENNNYYKYSISQQTFEDSEFEEVGQFNATHKDTKKTTTTGKVNSNSYLSSNNFEKMEESEDCDSGEENSSYDDDSQDNVEEIDDELDRKDADELLMSMSNRSIKINRLLEEQKRLMASLHVYGKLPY